MCLTESTELLPSCCEFHGFGAEGCQQGKLCPVQRPVVLTKSQVEGMDDMLNALERLSAQCERLRMPGQRETDAERNARAVIAKATGANHE